MMKSTKLLPSLAILALLTACSKKDSTAHYDDAQRYLANQQYSAAVIELRSAVRQSPEDYRFRLALGQALMATGELVAAERELQRALSYGAPAEQLAFQLVKLNYLLADYSAVISVLADVEDLTPRTLELVNSYRALAELELGDTPAALVLLEQLTLSTYADIKAFAHALLDLSGQAFDTATSQLLSIDNNSELYAEAVFLQSKLHLLQQDMLKAATALAHYLELTPSANVARLLLAQALVQTEQYEDATPHLTLLLRQFPEQPLANFLQAIVFFQSGNAEGAKTHSEKVLRDPTVNTRARIIAAISSMQLNLEAQALTHLDAVKEQLHLFPDAQRLYVMLQLRSGETEQAGSILASMPADEKDLQLIATTAFELVRKGAANSAQDLIKQYQLQRPQDADSLTTLGTIKLGIAGQAEAGIRDLQQALELDPTLNKTRMILASSYIQLKEFDKALALADGWINSADMATAGYSLKAYVKLLQQQIDDAFAITEQALKLTPQSPFPTLLQSSIIAQQGDIPKAASQLASMLDVHPEYQAGLEQYYTLSKALNNTNDATKRIEHAFKLNDQEYLNRLLLAKVAHDQQNYKRANELLVNANANANANMPTAHYLVLIDSYIKMGDISSALLQARQWQQQQPQNSEATYRLMNILSLNNQQDEALVVVNAQLAKSPAEPRLILAQLILLRELKKHEQALSVINNLPQTLAATAEIQFIKGQLLIEKNDSAASLLAFRSSYAKVPSHETAMYIALNLGMRSQSSAVTFLKQHIEQQGSNSGIDTHYATLLLNTNVEESKVLYKNLIEREPNNIVALNNYAWILATENNAAEAKIFAERAIKLQPNHPDILDTYGKILKIQGQHKAAITQFEKSLSIRPNHVEVQLNYAESLIQLGDKNQARQVLSNTQPVNAEHRTRHQQLLSSL